MAGRIIAWSKRAEISFDAILFYYASNPKSSKYGKKLLKKVTELTLLLLEFPDLGKMVQNSDYREFIIDNYSLFYKVFETEIYIAVFWDNRRNPELIKSELSKQI